MSELYFIISVILVNAQHRLATGLKAHSASDVCSPGYFQCENDTTCIPQDNNCNGWIDCPGGSDEKDCDDKNQDDFWDHLFKKRPSAENDNMSNICNLTYNGTCVCRGRELFCGHRGLTKIPEDLPKEDITLLDFEVNNFRALSHEFLRRIPPNVDKMCMTNSPICRADQISYTMQARRDNYNRNML